MPWVGIKPTQFAKNIKVEQEIRLNKAADFLLDRLIRDSPVDSGLFQDSWKSDGDYPLISLTNDARSPGGFPYPILLEEGYSSQAPHGVLRVNVSSLKVLMDQGVL